MIKKRHYYLIILFLLLFSIYLGFKYLFVYFTPFILGILMASLIDPGVNYLERELRGSRGAAAALSLFIFLTLILLVFTIILSGLIVELHLLIDQLPDYGTAVGFIQDIIDQNRELYLFIENIDIPPFLEDLIDENINELYNSMQELLLYLIETTIKALKLLPHIMLVMVVSCIAAFFFSRDKQIIKKSILKFLPTGWSTPAFKLYNEVVLSIFGYLRAELTLIAVTTTITTIGLLLLKSEYALVLGFTSGLLDLIPLVGPGLLFIPWILVSILTGNFVFAVYLSLLLVIISLFRQAVEPRVIGRGVGVHPLLILFSIYLCVQLFGFLGVFIGPLIMIIIKALFKTEIISTNKL